MKKQKKTLVSSTTKHTCFLSKKKTKKKMFLKKVPLCSRGGVREPDVHCGFLINAGSRDELENEHGLAHLIEHCLFKGTANRKAFHILSF